MTEEIKQQMEEAFINLLLEKYDDLRKSILKKERFIGIYVQKLKSINKENQYKYMTFEVINANDPFNNWLDYMLNLDDETSYWFKIDITSN